MTSAVSTDTETGSGLRNEPFAVDHILASDLPVTLGTSEAPERYTVTAIFTRRPLAQELELLRAPAVHEKLSAAGFPLVALSTGDRRLLIENTNLHELENGLSQTVADILDEIGQAVEAARSARSVSTAASAARESERQHEVVAEAARIDFSTTAVRSAR